MAMNNISQPTNSGASTTLDPLIIDRIVKAIDKMQGLITELESKVSVLTKSNDTKELITKMQKQICDLDAQNKQLSAQNLKLKDSVALILTHLGVK